MCKADFDDPTDDGTELGLGERNQKPRYQLIEFASHVDRSHPRQIGQ